MNNITPREPDAVLAPITDEDMRRGGLPADMKMAPGLAIYFVENLYQRCKAIALRMSEARGIVGEHLLNNPGACMAIISRSITWNLDPFAVAQSTYAVKGKIGYEGKLVQAILENSGSLEGQLKFEFFGDWDKLRGKFRMVGAVGSGERKPEQLWKDDDEAGLGVKVSAQVKGEASPREEEFFLAEMWPRNSTLWILRPKQQMRYATARAFGNIAVPGVLMGIPFDVDPEGMREVGGSAPSRPQPSEFTRLGPIDVADLGEFIAKANTAEKLTDIGTIRAEGLKVLPVEHHARFEEVCDLNAKRLTEKPKAAAPKVDAPKAEGEKDLLGEETPFQQGARLLAQVTACADVRELMDSIGSQLKGKDLKLWKETCQARFTELGGIGKVSTVPK